MNQKNLKLTFGIAAALFLVTPLLSINIRPQEYAGGLSRSEEDQEKRNTSAVAVMLGELRTSVSDIMFLKTERYLHGGVAYMPHMSDELEDVGLEGNIDASHAGTPTLIRTSDEDFRGPIGTMHRAVKPWMDPNEPHIHSSGTELLPWYRVLTLVDPHNVRGYSIGGYWLKGHDIDQGLDFLKEGIQNNPDAWALYSMLGRLQTQKAYEIAEEKPEQAAQLRAQASANFHRAVELGLAARPDDFAPQLLEEGETQDGWSLFEEEDLEGAARLSVFTERNFGSREQAIERAQQYLAELQIDQLRRFVNEAAAQE